MAFPILQARSTEDAPDPHFPQPGFATNSFELEPGDGLIRFADSDGVTATSIAHGTSTEVARAERIKGIAAITDSRFVFACTNFRTGGGWRGYGSAGAAVAVAANVLGRVAGGRETRGYSLVGHVRHEWLAGVTATRSRWGSSSANALRLLFILPSEPAVVCRLDVHLTRAHITADLARDLVRRAAAVQARTATGELAPQLEIFRTALPSKPLSSGNGETWTLPQ